ncbi:MAG: zinc ribbon domain-containing protein [Persicimonas sp.]
MTLLLIILAVIFTLVAAYNVVTPFLSSERDQLRFELLDEDLRRVEELASQRALLLQELRDITLDRETGKISQDNYEELKATYERQAVQVMKELNDIHGGRGWEEAIDDELERRLARFEAERARQGAENAEPSADFIECPECSKRLEPEARFCSRCGTNIAENDPRPADDQQVDDQQVDGQQVDDPLADSQPASIESRALSNPGSEVAT